MAIKGFSDEVSDAEPACFVALYRGRDISSARLVAVTTDKDAIIAVVEGIGRSYVLDSLTSDPVLKEMHSGRQRTLRAVRKELETTGCGRSKPRADGG